MSRPRSIAQAGFGAVYMTGAGTAATLVYPDYGLLTMSEMADNAGRIAASVDLPVIADAALSLLPQCTLGFRNGPRAAVPPSLRLDVRVANDAIQGLSPVGMCGADFGAFLRKQYDEFGRKLNYNPLTGFEPI